MKHQPFYFFTFRRLRQELLPLTCIVVHLLAQLTAWKCPPILWIFLHFHSWAKCVFCSMIKAASVSSRKLNLSSSWYQILIALPILHPSSFSPACPQVSTSDKETPGVLRLLYQCPQLHRVKYYLEVTLWNLDWCTGERGFYTLQSTPCTSLCLSSLLHPNPLYILCVTLEMPLPLPWRLQSAIETLSRQCLVFTSRRTKQREIVKQICSPPNWQEGMVGPGFERTCIIRQGTCFRLVH